MLSFVVDAILWSGLVRWLVVDMARRFDERSCLEHIPLINTKLSQLFKRAALFLCHLEGSIFRSNRNPHFVAAIVTAIHSR